MASWRVNPEAPAVQRLIDLIKEGFRGAGGDFNAGRELPSLFGSLGVEPRLDAHVVALSPGHPYLRLPLQFATSLRSRLETLLGKADLDTLVRQTELELSRPGTWGTTFTPYPGICLTVRITSKSALERTAGSHALAAAAHRNARRVHATKRRKSHGHPSTDHRDTRRDL
jgi:hypothetical protein